MPANLGLDASIDALIAVPPTGTDWPAKFVALIEAALKSTSNPFGSAAVRSSGTSAGTVPVLGTGGKLDRSTIGAIPPSSVTGNIPANMLPRFPASVFTSGTMPLANVPPFGHSKFTGRLDAARVPPAPASGTPITSVASSTTLQLTFDRNRPSIGSQPAPIARIDARHLTVTRAGSTLNVNLAYMGTIRPASREQ